MTECNCDQALEYRWALHHIARLMVRAVRALHGNNRGRCVVLMQEAASLALSTVATYREAG